MNPLVKIITQIIVLINKLIDSMNKRTVETIKHSFFALCFIALVIAAITGYNIGMGAAKKQGEPFAKNTNKIFSIIINKEKNEGQFNSMLDSELMNERKNFDQKKITYPSNENFESEFNYNIIESETNKKLPPSVMSNEKEIAETNRIESHRIEPDVRTLANGNEFKKEKKDANFSEDKAILNKKADNKVNIFEKIKTKVEEYKAPEPIKTKEEIIEK